MAALVLFPVASRHLIVSAIGQFVGLWLGFVVVGGIVLIVGLILWIFKDGIIRRPIMNSLIKTMFDNEDDEKD